MRTSRLVQVDAVEEDEVVESQPVERVERVQAAATQMMVIALKALSQRALVALSNLFMLLTAASVFALWYSAPANPSIAEIVSRALYALFVLALNIVKRGPDARVLRK